MTASQGLPEFSLFYLLLHICPSPPVFQAEDKIIPEPRLKKLEPVLLPGKHSIQVSEQALHPTGFSAGTFF